MHRCFGFLFSRVFLPVAAVFISFSIDHSRQLTWTWNLVLDLLELILTQEVFYMCSVYIHVLYVFYMVLMRAGN